MRTINKIIKRMIYLYRNTIYSAVRLTISKAIYLEGKYSIKLLSSKAIILATKIYGKTFLDKEIAKKNLRGWVNSQPLIGDYKWLKNKNKK